jgi:hypothetical protein
MKYPLPRKDKTIYIFILLISVILSTSCKKEITEILINPFENLNTLVNHENGVYQISFTLEKYPYDKYFLKLSSDKNSFYKNINIKEYPAYALNSSRYSTYINLLEPDKIYYYQIVVVDSKSTKEIYSDVFSFKTEP